MIIATRLPWGTYSAWRNVDNMLQLMRFSLYCFVLYCIVL